jgi:ABC-type nitrate/sulfonate/bicarbonate transport system substrate-binding protein
MHKFSWPMLLTLALGAYLLAGCKPSSPAPAKPLRIGILKHESSLPFYLADEAGLFKKHGLDATLVELPPGDHLPALLADRVDVVSPTSFPPLFGIMVQHTNLLYVVFPGAEVSGGQTVYGLIVRSNSTDQSVRDIRGGVIMAINPYTKVSIQMILSAAGAPKENWPDIRVASREVAVQAVSDGTATAAIMDQPALAVALTAGGFKLLESNPRAKYVGSPYWSGAGAVKREAWNSRKADFEHLLAAVDESIALIRKDSHKAHEILAARLGLSQAIADQCGGYYFPLTTDPVDKAGIQKTVDALRSAGLLEGPVALDNFFPPGLYGEK